jgi:hypothetical protein
MPCSCSGLGIGHAPGSRTPPPLAESICLKTGWNQGRQKNLDFDASSSETLRVSRKQPDDDLESIVVYSSDLDLKIMISKIKMPSRNKKKKKKFLFLAYA